MPSGPRSPNRSSPDSVRARCSAGTGVHGTAPTRGRRGPDVPVRAGSGLVHEQRAPRAPPSVSPPCMPTSAQDAGGSTRESATAVVARRPRRPRRRAAPARRRRPIGPKSPAATASSCGSHPERVAERRAPGREDVGGRARPGVHVHAAQVAADTASTPASSAGVVATSHRFAERDVDHAVVGGDDAAWRPAGSAAASCSTKPVDRAQLGPPRGAAGSPAGGRSRPGRRSRRRSGHRSPRRTAAAVGRDPLARPTRRRRSHRRAARPAVRPLPSNALRPDPGDRDAGSRSPLEGGRPRLQRRAGRLGDGSARVLTSWPVGQPQQQPGDAVLPGRQAGAQRGQRDRRGAREDRS